MAVSSTVLSPEQLICGLRIRLLALETTKSKWSTVLVGARPGRYLIVEMPTVAGCPMKLDIDSRWAVNFINNGMVYSFNSEVIGYTYRMVPLLFLQYPQTVEVASLRTMKRYPVNIPAILNVAGTSDEPNPDHAPLKVGDEFKALMVDISEGGCLVATTAYLHPGSILRLTLFLPKGGPIKDVFAEVKTCRSQSMAHYAGLSFSKVTMPESSNLVTDLINSLENSPLRI